MSGIDKQFDYSVPDALRDDVRVGTIVRVPLGGRTVRGWVVEDGVRPPDGVAVRPITAVSSVGPSQEVIGVARWSEWRYSGRSRPFLLAASPPRVVRALPLARSANRPGHQGGPIGPEADLAGAGLDRAAATPGKAAVVRLPPAASRLAFVESVLARAGESVLVLLPTRAEAEILTRLLGERRVHAVLHADRWPEAAAGGAAVIGTRSAAFASTGPLGAIVVFDAHAESYVETRAPTWRAPVVAAERARIAGCPCLLVSPCPTPELLAEGPLVAPDRAFERSGWSPVTVHDRRGADPRTGRYAEGLAELARSEASPARPVIFVLNRTGRGRLLACARCGELARCEQCGAAMAQSPAEAAAESALRCPQCASERPSVCAACGARKLKLLRVGTARVAEEVRALTGLAVEEVTAARRSPAPGDEAVGAFEPAPVLVGTEAVLHRVRRAAAVVFLEPDGDLLSPRLGAGGAVLAQMALASRLLGGRDRSHPIVVQTRVPEHDAIRAVVRADPSLLTDPEIALRRRLGLPPARVVAQIAGEDAEIVVEAAVAASGGAIERTAGGEGVLLLRAPDHETLCDALAKVGARDKGVRIEVDPIHL